jgi:type IV fimbrial biogenesis protein FimT
MNSMTLFTMPRMGLENSIRTIEKDSYSRVPMVFHRLTRSSIRYRGFTLIELLVTLAIVAIVAVIAAPSLQNFVLNNRIRSQAGALTTSLMLARTEAITRSTRVVTCPRPVNNTCKCSGTSGIEWESGWHVFVDSDGDKECDSDDSLLEVHGSLDGSETTLHGIGNLKYAVFFNHDGRVQKPDGTLQSGTFVLCDQRGWGSDARAIEVLPTGRIRTLIATDSSVSGCKPPS